jgi:hypothetical protein
MLAALLGMLLAGAPMANSNAPTVTCGTVWYIPSMLSVICLPSAPYAINIKV